MSLPFQSLSACLGGEEDSVSIWKRVGSGLCPLFIE